MEDNGYLKYHCPDAIYDCAVENVAVELPTPPKYVAYSDER